MDPMPSPPLSHSSSTPGLSESHSTASNSTSISSSNLAMETTSQPSASASSCGTFGPSSMAARMMASDVTEPGQAAAAAWTLVTPNGIERSPPSSSVALRKLPPLQKAHSDRDSTRRPRIQAPPSSGGGDDRQQRPALRTTRTSSSNSRPSSIVSNSSSVGGGGEGSSSSSHGHYNGRAALSPSILSPSLASALGIGAEGRKRGSLYSSSASNGSSTSLTGMSPPSHYHHQHRSSVASTGGGVGANLRASLGSYNAAARAPRRPSLPIIPSMMPQAHRMSTVSTSSFESLPEAEPSGSSPTNHGGSDDLAATATIPFSTGQIQLDAAGAPPSSTLESSQAPAFDHVPALMLPPASIPTQAKEADMFPVSPRSRPQTVQNDSIDERPPPPQPFPKAVRRALMRSQTEPAGASASPFQAKMRKRGLIARELLTTERAYVDSLQVINESFYQPLLARCGGLRGASSSDVGPKILSRKTLADIFSNFVDILQLNAELLSQLEERLEGGAAKKSQVIEATALPSPRRASKDDMAAFPSRLVEDAISSADSAGSNVSHWDPDTGTVGDILVPIAPFLKMYSLYVKNFSSALARIETERRDNEAFARFLKETERSTWGKGKAFSGLGLQAHLLTIVQRIPRYKLLVGDLLSCTPSGHCDHRDLKRAFEMIGEVASTINENVRHHEMVMLMLALQRSLSGLTVPLVVPGRTLLRRGTLLKACRKDIQPRAFFLFNDCIVYARPTGTSSSANIEATWSAIVRAAGISSASLPVELRTASNLRMAHHQRPTLPTSHRTSFDQASSPMLTGMSGGPQGNNATSSSADALLQARNRVSSGNLFSGNILLDALQAPQSQQLQFRDKYSLQDCTVVGIEQNTGVGHGHHHLQHAAYPAISSDHPERGGTPFAFELRTPDKSFVVYAETADSREAWLTAVREARNEWLEARRTLRAEEDSIEAKRDKRRSVVAAAAAAAARGRHSVYSMAMPSNASIPEGHEAMHTASETLADISDPVMLGGSDDTAQHSAIPAISQERPSAGVGRAMAFTQLPSSTSIASLLSSAAGGVTAMFSSSNPPPALKVLEDYNAPAWVPDSQADRCMACSEAFGVFKRRSHCRVCGRVVCWNCSTKRFLIASWEESQEDRVARCCDSCYASIFPEEVVESSSNSQRQEVQQRRSLGEGTSGSNSSASVAAVTRSVSGGSRDEGSTSGSGFDGQDISNTRPFSVAAATSSSGPADDSLDFVTLPSTRRGSVPALLSPLEALTVEDESPLKGSFTMGQALEGWTEQCLPEPSNSTPRAAELTTAASSRAPARSPPPSPRKSLALATRLPLMESQRRSNDATGHLRPFPSKGQAENRKSLATTGGLGSSSSFTHLLFPQVQAATSGHGTFRLAPPRITTPEGESPPRLMDGRTFEAPLGEEEGEDEEEFCTMRAPIKRRGGSPSKKTRPTTLGLEAARKDDAPLGDASSYFSRAVLPDKTGDGPTSTIESHPFPIQGGVEAAPPSPSLGERQQVLPQRKKRLSAAARLSSYYHSAGFGKASTATVASEPSADR